MNQEPAADPAPTSRAEVVVRVRDARKAFPGIVALDDVSLEVLRGEIHILVGENGAGKSTLVKVLSGVHPLDAGALEVDGRPVDGWSTDRALADGIRTIYQEFNLVPHLSVMENIFLGAEPTRLGGLLRDVRSMERRASETLARLGVNIDVHRRVHDLGVAEQQLVEIAKALHHAQPPRLLIFDEPTAALSMREAERLLEIISRLADDGIGVLYVTHRFEELSHIGDRITVMRDGSVVTTRPLRELDRRAIVQLMVGRDVEDWRRTDRTSERRLGTAALELRGGSRHGEFSGIDLTLRQGEIVGMFGLVGAGRTQLLHALMGDGPLDEGVLTVDGERVLIRGTTTATRLGMGISPEDRKGQGIIPGRSVRDNITLRSLGRLTRWGIVLDRRGADNLTSDYIERLRIKTPDTDAPVGKLSGGNQQKVVLARLLCAGARILLFDEPTRGIDVAAKREVYALINELANAGNAVLVVTSELEEALSVADRLLVMREGRLSGEVDPSDTAREAVLHLAFPVLSSGTV